MPGLAPNCPRTRIIYYTVPDTELLHHQFLNEAVNAELESRPDFNYPETIGIAHYRPIPVAPPQFVKALQDLIDASDE